MLRVGLTGNIASGKSTVARRWRELGLTVIDADALAREVVRPGSPGLARVRAEFGDSVLDEKGGLDRAALRRIVFAQDEARRRLESIVHPQVARLRTQREGEAAAAGAALVVHEIPLLFEVGLADEFDVLVLVDAPADVRVERLVRERGLEETEARAMVAAQMPAEEKRARAHYVIDNQGTRAALLAEAGRVARELEQRAGG